MPNKHWMNNQEISDVSTAIQSQSIQTALERNTTKLSPDALQSYLVAAPIPRMISGDMTGTYNNGITTNAIFSRVNGFDPFSMLVFNAGLGVEILTFPIDGFYSVVWRMHVVGGTGAGAFVETLITDSAGFLDLDLCENNTTGVYRFHTTLLKPYRAGQNMIFQVFNNSTAALTVGSGCRVSATWVAPYNVYTGGN